MIALVLDNPLRTFVRANRAAVTALVVIATCGSMTLV